MISREVDAPIVVYVDVGSVSSARAHQIAALVRGSLILKIRESKWLLSLGAAVAPMSRPYP